MSPRNAPTTAPARAARDTSETPDASAGAAKSSASRASSGKPPLVPPVMQRIAIVNFKGGVGKTTTTVNLAAGLARAGRRVLLVDLDGQANASLGLGIPRDELAPSIAAVLLENRPLAEVVRATGIAGLSLVTADASLYGADAALASTMARETRLAKALRTVASDYDVVLFDCSPALSVVTANALLACDVALIPVVPEYYAVEGLATLESTLEELREAVERPIPVLGVVLSRVTAGERATGELVAAIRSHYGAVVFDTPIRKNIRLSEAPSFGQDIFGYAPDSPGAKDFQGLTREVLARLAAFGAGQGVPLPPGAIEVLDGVTPARTSGAAAATGAASAVGAS